MNCNETRPDNCYHVGSSRDLSLMKKDLPNSRQKPVRPSPPVPLGGKSDKDQEQVERLLPRVGTPFEKDPRKKAKAKAGPLKSRTIYTGLSLIWQYGLVLLVILFFAAIRVRLLDFPLERDEGEYAYAG